MKFDTKKNYVKRKLCIMNHITFLYFFLLNYIRENLLNTPDIYIAEHSSKTIGTVIYTKFILDGKKDKYRIKTKKNIIYGRCRQKILGNTNITFGWLMAGQDKSIGSYALV
jgi:beta-mannanase